MMMRIDDRQLRFEDQFVFLFCEPGIVRPADVTKPAWLNGLRHEGSYFPEIARISRPRHRPAPQSSRIITLRPVDTDGIAPVPVQSGLAHLIKDADADGRRLRHLNDRARVPFIEKIDEGAARSVTLLADLPTGCQRALAELTIVHRPA